MQQTNEAIPGRAAHILIAEDEDATRRALSLILKQAGYDVVSVENGQKAFDYIKKAKESIKPVDLLLTDLQMAQLSGMELLDCLLSHSLFLPVLVITGYGDKQTVVELLRRGCADYLDKPLDPQDVLDRVQRVLSRKAQDELTQKENTRQFDRERAKLNYELEAYQSNFDRLQKQLQSAIIAHKDLVSLDIGHCRLHVACYQQPLAELGGDFIDVRDTPTGCDVFVADVSGHDIGASYHTVLLKAFFDENCRKRNNGRSFFKLLNQQLLDNGRNERMVTGIFVRVNLESMTAEVVSAGHPYPIRVRSSMPVPMPLVIEGDVLGLSEDVHFECRTFPVTPGDRLFLYTDGLTDVSCTDTESGARRVLMAEGVDEMIGRHATIPLQQLVDKVSASVLKYCNYKPDDDMLLVGLEIP